MTSPVHHTDVGAYAIGALDEADAARFEEHLAACDPCAHELQELLPLGPVLADFAQDAPHASALTARPDPKLLDRLLDEAGTDRRRHRRRRLTLVAAAAALIIAAPLAGAAVLGGQDQAPGGTLAQAVYEDGQKVSASDPATDVAATVALVPRDWGTQVAVKLTGLSGPERCDLVAVGRDGTEQTVTTWAVSATGYGWQESDYFTGGAAYAPAEIARFEVRTLDGDHLVTVNTGA
ncbi:zf-HC2 domain-containing protein [Streptomyces sp. JJ66]|uniref:anti-sigma factor family protein n=1 Tax=Streptomyces sp. JJ66 TaxID=2803843 RepID=UPI001C55A862|nr:zf-HC2 domain-containing protein [Streptomyces sp. JJ66]MBW1603213.1 zf-HC2 domain-containing protein [Streptomyces sp. JJ66]